MPLRRDVLAAATLLAGPARAQAEPWRRYHDPYLGTHIDYPARFVPDPGHAQTSIARFVSGDGAAFLVLGRRNAQGLAELQALAMESLGSPGQPTYRAQGRNWFVLSGHQAGLVLYEKHVLSAGGRFVHSFVMTYPDALRRSYDAIVTRMSRSFGAAEMTPG